MAAAPPACELATAGAARRRRSARNSWLLQGLPRRTVAERLASAFGARCPQVVSFRPVDPRKARGAPPQEKYKEVAAYWRNEGLVDAGDEDVDAASDGVRHG